MPDENTASGASGIELCVAPRQHRGGGSRLRLCFPHESQRRSLRHALKNFSDVSELAAAIRAGTLDPARIVAVLGKTEGNGLVNDFTRGYLIQSSGCWASTATSRWSTSATEGVLSPHYAGLPLSGRLFREGNGALAVGCSLTRDLRPEEIGTTTQGRAGSRRSSESDEGREAHARRSALRSGEGTRRNQQPHDGAGAGGRGVRGRRGAGRDP